jgi:hypothetical protein
MANDDSDENHFVCENMQNCKGQTESFMGSVGAQGAAKHVVFLNCFSIEN